MGRISDTLRQCFGAIRRATCRKKRGRRGTLSSIPDTVGATIQPRIAEGKTTATGEARPGWNFCREAEFPWRLEQVVDEEENWRGTWVLEVKDLRAMNWETSQVSKEKGKGGKYVRQPTRQLPFPVDGRPHFRDLSGGQDDLLAQLGRGELIMTSGCEY